MRTFHFYILHIICLADKKKLNLRKFCDKTFDMNKILLSILAVLALLTASCSSDHFTVKGELADAGTQNIRIAYATGDGIETVWITMTDNRFTFEGQSEAPTVVYVFNQQRRLIAHIVAQNGDKVTMEGSIAEPYKIKITGTDANEEWSKFMNENCEDFANAQTKKTDAAIEAFIHENPNNVVSTLLLTNDYSSLTDDPQTKKLLSMISTEARPESLMKNFYIMQSALNDAASKERIQSMQLYSSRDSIETVAPYMHSLNLLYFWTPDDKSRIQDIKSLKDFMGSFASSRLSIADINLDNDTTMWKNIVRRDSMKCTRYWAVGGVMNTALRNLRLSSTPYYIVADSAGNQVYHGQSLQAARKMIESRLK